MKKIIIALLIGCISSQAVQGQIFQGIGNKLKNKVTEKLNGQIERTTDKALDKLDKKHLDAKAKETATKSDAIKGKTADPVRAYSKYDFIPGDKIVYMDDFSRSAMGEMPEGWNANGKGEIVRLDGYPGKFLRMFPATKYLSGNTTSLGDSFSIEFDLIMTGTPPSGTRYFPELALGLFSSDRKRTTDNSFLGANPPFSNHTQILLKPNVDADSKAILHTRGAMGATFFESGIVPVKEYAASFYQSAHYAIQVEKQRIRFWVNGQKIFDAPQGIKSAPLLNQFYINPLEYWFYNEENFGLYLNNLRIATGVPKPMKAILDGKGFSTNGILFNVASDELKSQSLGILKSVSDALKEDPSIRIKIIGHTDNDGKANENLILSKKRAESVRKTLIGQFGIEESRLSVEGKGASVPLEDNLSSVGKAMNRRVEFVRL